MPRTCSLDGCDKWQFEQALCVQHLKEKNQKDKEALGDAWCCERKIGLKGKEQQCGYINLPGGEVCLGCGNPEKGPQIEKKFNPTAEVIKSSLSHSPTLEEIQQSKASEELKKKLAGAIGIGAKDNSKDKDEVEDDEWED